MTAWARKGLAVVWSSDAEFAEAVTATLNVMGYSALVPGSRGFRRICGRARLVVVDARDARYLPSSCGSAPLLEVGGSTGEAVADLLRILGASELAIGIDPGESATGYAMVAQSTVLHGSVVPSRADVAGLVCGIVRRAPGLATVGIGAAPAVRRSAVALAGRLRSMCGVNAVLVDESGSNREAPPGLRGLGPGMSVHVRAAAVIALRARVASAIVG